MERTAVWSICVLALVLAGCRDGGSARSKTAGAEGGVDTNRDAGAGEDAGASEDPGGDPSAALFRPDHIVQVSLTLKPADWDELRNQQRELGVPDVNCANQPPGKSYTDFPAAITVDGITLTNVAVRKKGGFGSISSARPGLKVDVSEYVDEQRLFGLRHLTLNNNIQDPALISQCLGYGLFRKAGVPASRCNFAHVFVNGEDLGVYSNIESIKKEFLERNFADDSGNLYESGGEFAPGAVGGFQVKSGANPPDCSDLDAVVEALSVPDAALPQRLGSVVDVDEFTRFWAMEVITDHWDGYANNQNNYYFYHDPTSDKLTFIPWGIDALFSGRERTTRPSSVFACGALAWRLYDVPSTRTKYLDTLRELLDTVWDAPTILKEVDRMQALLLPIANPAQAGALEQELEKVRSFVQTRKGRLLAELDAGDPVWPYSVDQSCRISLGPVSASFETTWDTLEMFGAGSGTMEGTIAGVSLTSSDVRVLAGLGDEGKPVIQLLNLLEDGRYAVIFVLIQDSIDLKVGTYDIDLANVAALMTFYDPAKDESSGGGIILPGRLTLTQASNVSGAVVSGSLMGEVLEL